MQPINQQQVQVHNLINEKIKKAIAGNSKVQFYELIENGTLQDPTQEEKEKMNKIINQVGKENLSLRVEELKVITAASPNKANLAWFIQHILTKRLSS
jgi:hypothetical protein